MRRRRNAAASPDSLDSAETEALDIPTDSLPMDTPSALPDSGPEGIIEASTPTKPRRRAASTRRKTSVVEAEASAAEVVDPTPAATADLVAPPEPEVTPKAKPRASTRRRKGDAAAAVPEEEVTPVEAAAEAMGTVETAAPAAIEAVPVAEVLIENIDDTPLDTETAPRSGRSSRRRGGSGRRRGNGPNTTEGSETAPVSNLTTAPVPPEIPGDGTGRTRGLRRRAVTPPPATVAVPVIDLSVPVGEATEDGKPRRVRGLRRAAPASAVLVADAVPATAAPVTAGTISDPLPPAYKPLPAETLARLAEAKVIVYKNVPELVVNDEVKLPIWFFVNTEDPDGREVARREIRLAYEAGVRTFSVMAHLPWRTRSGERRYDVLDEALQFVADNAPDALILPRLIFSPPASWERTHPAEMAAYADGETGDVSIASRAFWEGEAEEALRAAVERVAEGPFAGRVFGFYLEHGEWLYEKGRGYDISEANEQGFRSWLRTRYKNSSVALRAAWNDGSVTFETAAIPPQPVPSGPTLFFTAREQRYADFHEYASDSVAQVIIRLGSVVKEASGGRSAVAVSYGYTLELARAYSGHLALAQVLASPFVDILTGPVSYSGRTPGGSAPFPAPVDSVALAGKLWISEDDTKTFLSATETPDTYNPKVPSFEGTWEVYARNFGAAMARGTGLSWMDLWGTGWLDDRDLWQRVGLLRDVADQLTARRHSPDALPLPEPDVAVIVDERSFFEVRGDDTLLPTLIAHQRDVLLRSGARVGFYLLSDLLKENFPKGPRLLLFLNAFCLPDAVRTVLKERFQDDGRTLAWVYAPGGQEQNLAELSDTLGMQLRIQPWGSKMGTQVLSNGRSPLTEALRGQRLGEETRVNPSYYVNDPKAQVLGEYVATGYPSLAVRKHPRWQSVFLGETQITLPLLRGLYRLAGVPVYTVDDDVAWLGESLICLHSAPGGGTTVFLPEDAVLYDLLNRETLASDGRGARLSMPPRGTRLLFYGTPDEVIRLGGDPKAGPSGLSASELPPPPQAFVFEGSASAAVPPIGRGANRPSQNIQEDDISPEDAALMEAAFTGAFPLDADSLADDEIDREEIALVPVEAAVTAPLTETSAEGMERKKRRRRRRRRGEGDGAEIGGESDDADTEEPLAVDTDSADDFPADEDTAVTLPTDDADSRDEETVFVPMVQAPQTRTRPSLAELLPDSDIAEGTDLPPIPEEFLPHGENALSSTDAEEAEEAPRPVRRPRRRTSTPRRGTTAAAAASSPEAKEANPIDDLSAETVLPTDEAAFDRGEGTA